MNREATINFLIANCGCWGSGDKELLNELTDNKLNTLQKNCEKSNADSMIANAAREGFSFGDRDFKYDEEGNQFVTRNNMAGGGCDDDEDEDDEEEAPAMNRRHERPKDTYTPRQKATSMKEWLAMAPEGATEVWNHSQQVYNQRRAELIEKLKQVADDTNDRRKQTLIANKLNGNPTPAELEELLILVSPVSNQDRIAPQHTYLGASAAPIGNAFGGPPTQSEEDKNDYLDIPTINWAEENK